MSELDNKPWHWNPTFAGLMDELIVKIFSFCSTERLVICSMVCKRWRKLVTHPSLRLVKILVFFVVSFCTVHFMDKNVKMFWFSLLSI
jgi:hypothetical protein